MIDNGDNSGAGALTRNGAPSSLPAKSFRERFLPMNIKEIHECSESGLRLYGMVNCYVNLVSTVRGVDISPVKVTFKLEDHTGDIDGTFWFKENNADNPIRIILNTHVKVFGNVENVGGTKKLTIFEIESTINPNVVGVTGQAVKIDAFPAVRTNPDAGYKLGLSGNQYDVYAAIQKSQSEHGIEFQELKQMFTHMSASELRTITDFMKGEGFIYTVTESDYFKCSESCD